MELSTNWIKDYVSMEDVNLNNLAKEISLAGINIPIVKKQVDINNLVIGYVEDIRKHTDSDHLNVCNVNIGKEVTQIVCGAPNVDKNQKVIVALPGAMLPGGEIKKSVIRGEESNGMICALFELGLGGTYEDGIHVLDKDAPVGEDPLKYLGVDDTIFVTDVKGNRKVDSTNYLGMAYEVGTILDKEVILPETSYKENNEDINSIMSLKVETDKCLMYLGKLVKNIKVGESPLFIKNRLIASGMRSINNVVDISNYIMLETGQPLHFFDADKLNNKVLVRDSKKDEEVVTLDNEKRNLKEGTVVITIEEDVVAVAGVMGCLNSEVTDDTKNIFIESAIFDGISVRKTSLDLDLRSEAATRYERGLGYEYTLLALKRACFLLEKYASGEVVGGMLNHDITNKKEIIVNVTLDKINTVLGLNLSKEEVNKYLDRLKFSYKEKEGNYEIIQPNRRRDINIPEDIIEEVGRLYGFHNIKAFSQDSEVRMGKYDPKIKYRKDISKYMRSLGLNETRTYTLVKEKEAEDFNTFNKNIISLPNPISKERTHLRVSLVPSLLEVYKYNSNRGVNDINIYEISNVYSKDNDEYKEDVILSTLISGNYLTNKWNKNIIKSDFFVLKGIVEQLLNHLGFDKRYSIVKTNEVSFLHPGVSAFIKIDNEIVGFIGKVHPGVMKGEIFISEINLSLLEIKKTSKIKYKESSIYPTVKRDMAFLFKNDIVVGDVLKEINKNGNKILSNVEVFDVYEKENEKSIAFSLYFESLDHTLTDDEINNAFNRIIDSISTKFNAILRNK